MTATFGHWIGANDFVVPTDECPIPPYEAWEDLQQGQAVWFQIIDSVNPRTGWSETEPHVGSLMDSVRSKLVNGDKPFIGKRVGGYFRVFRLWNGPARKLSDWHQLPPGSSMLLALDHCEKEEELALHRRGYFARRGYGTFTVETHDDGSLWVAKS